MAATIVLCAAGTAAADKGSRDGSDVTPRAPAKTSAGLSRLRRSLGREGFLSVAPGRTTPRFVGRTDGYLTPPSRRDARQIVLAYLQAHDAAFRLDRDDIRGLRLVRRYTSRGKVIHLTFAQTYRGIPALDSQVTANITRDGRLINLSGSPLPDLHVADPTPEVSAEEALRTARREARAGTRRPGFPGPRFSDGRRTRLVITDTGGRTSLAWRVLVESAGGEHFDVLVDADERERVLRRRRLSADQNALVFDHYPGAPRGGDQRTVDISGYRYGDTEYGLYGPFAFTFADVNANDGFSSSELIQPGVSGDYDHTYVPFPAVADGNCPPAPYYCSWDHHTPFSWRANRDQAGTQLFWYVNRFHDHLRSSPIEFTPSKGNMEGTDRVWAYVDTGASVADGLPDEEHINNAFFSFSPDGSPPKIETHLYRSSELDPRVPTVNSADDAGMVYHEYTHGLSSRLVTDAQGVNTLDFHQSLSLGEAWSDWYALDHLVGSRVIPDTAADGQVAAARYLHGGPGEFRTQPIDCGVGASSTACPASPEGAAGSGGYTFGDMGKVIGYPEPHADGEIFAQTLWDLRKRLIKEYGRAGGLYRTRLLVTAGIELSPARPSFLDIRDSIIQADLVYLDGEETSLIWDVFAKRGMGYFASSLDSTDRRAIEDFSLPPKGESGRLSGTVRSASGKPVAGARVFVAGRTGALASELDRTDAAGRYVLRDLAPGVYPQLAVAPTAGLDGEVTADVRVAPGRTTRRDFTLVRDWAALEGGARAVAVSHEYPGCEGRRLLDQSFGGGWLTISPASSERPGPKSVTVELPRAVDISSLAIDPTAPCYTGYTASLGDYSIAVSRDRRNFRSLTRGRFVKRDNWRRNVLPVAEGDGKRVRYLRLTAISSQSHRRGRAGRRYVGATELQVYGAVSE